MKAADVMVSNVITVGVDASIGEVAATLLNNHISGAPVVGKNGELVGIVLCARRQPLAARRNRRRLSQRPMLWMWEYQSRLLFPGRAERAPNP